MKTVKSEPPRVQEETDNSGRIALVGILLVLAFLVAAVKLLAQEGPGTGSVTVRPLVGAYVPTGELRDFLKDAVLIGAQGTWYANSNWSITGSLGWAPSRDKITPGDRKLDAFQYDLGVEARAATPILAPFVGLGVGGRIYSYRNYNVASKTNFDGYGSVGFDALPGPVNIRVEVRDYVSRLQPFTGSGSTKTRNDLAFFAGLGFRL